MFVRDDFGRFEMIDPLLTAAPFENYEHLKGGQGKQINFRQKRYNVPEILKEVKLLNPRMNCALFDGALVDFSISGALARVDGRLDVEFGAEIPSLSISIEDSVLYVGRAKVAHYTYNAENGTSAHTMVGVQLLDRVLDMGRFFKVRAMAGLRQELTDTDSSLAANSISPSYREAVSDMLYLVSRYRSALTRQQRQLQDLDGSARDSMEIELLEMAWARMKEPINAIQDRFDELTSPHYFDLEFRKAYKKYTLSLLTPHFVSGPFFFRAWYKPLGYPGDYRVMEHIYNRDWEGDNLYAKLIHRYGVEHILSEAVRSRRRLLKNCIVETVHELEKREDNEPCKILSLGSGPAGELIDFLEEYKGTRPIEVTLIDQDNRALALANQKISEIILSSSASIQAHYYYISFRDLLRDRALFDSVPSGDIVYCAGLFDYLRERQAQVVLADLLLKVRPAGTMVVGNFGGPPTHAWGPTYLMDWDLLYRDYDEMVRIASVIPPEVASSDIITDETKTHYFIKSRKK